MSHSCQYLLSPAANVLGPRLSPISSSSTSPFHALSNLQHPISPPLWPIKLQLRSKASSPPLQQSPSLSELSLALSEHQDPPPQRSLGAPRSCSLAVPPALTADARRAAASCNPPWIVILHRAFLWLHLHHPLESMAESILLHVAEKLVDKLGSFVMEEVSMAWGLKDELKKLQKILTAISAVIAEAEKRESQETTLREWLDDLKDVLYDSENVLDEFECEALRKKVTKAGNLRRKVRRFFSCSNPIAFRFKMGHKIREIRERLGEITIRKDAFNLNQQPGSGSGGASHTISRETHSYVHLPAIIGRENDRDAIVERLKCQDNVQYPYIVSIVGIGGLGKTALAKMVYDDSTVEFDKRVWVCVSDDFNLKRILQKIVKILDPTMAPPSILNMDLEQLQENLRNLLKGKKFLLVLDDVWNENRRQWNDLSDLLTGGKRGSSIIVTTRSSKVASTVGTCYEHKLKELSHDSCMALLKKPNTDGLARSIDPEILEIVGQIVKKCGGVPLVVKALGSLLSSNADVRYWRTIKDKDIFTMLQNEDDVKKIIKLSYDHLPPHLKRCFHFCTLFPKGYQLGSAIVATYWKSLGLIDLRNKNIQNPEVIAEQYMKELLARSFFQDFEDYGDVFGFKIHDLMHDLAWSVPSYECSTINFETPTLLRGVQHVYVSANTFNNQEASRQTVSFLKKANNYRTLMLNDFTGSRFSKELLETCISSSKYLRVLDLEGTNFEVIPSSIGTLKHLRFLNISRNCTIRRLPSSICNLQSLQSMLLLGCESLEELPRNMWKLINLEQLHLTTKQKSLKSSGIGSLKSLKELLISDCDNLECLFEGMDVKDLTALRRLFIDQCGSLTRIPVNNLKFLTSLEFLVIGRCPKLDMSMDEEPFPSTLRTILIGSLPLMSTLPKWFLGSADKLESLFIEDWGQLEELPEWLKHFRNLKRLEIAHCNKVASLPDGMQSLTALRRLNISHCEELEDRCQLNGTDWNKIAHIPEFEINGKRINH